MAYRYMSSEPEQAIDLHMHFRHKVALFHSHRLQLRVPRLRQKSFSEDPSANEKEKVLVASTHTEKDINKPTRY